MKAIALLMVGVSLSEAFTAPSIFPIGQDFYVSSSTALNAATLYGHPGTRSPLVNWGAAETKFKIEMGDLTKNPHPFGQIPCLSDDDDVILFESGAILQYIHSKTNENMSAKDKAAVISWISWANASLDPICFLETPDGKVYDTGLKRPQKRLDQLDRLLSKTQYLLGDGEDNFSLADVAVASYLLYVLQFFPGVDISQWPNMKRYMKDCASRSAYGEAFGKRTQDSLLKQLNEAQEKKLFGMF